MFLLDASKRAVALLQVINIVASFAVLLAFLHEPGINHYEPSAFKATIAGEAHRPFVFRALVPAMVRGAAELIPSDARRDFVMAAKTKRVAMIRKYLDGIPAQLWPEFVIAFVIMFAALLASNWALKWLLRAVYDVTPLFAEVTNLVALAILPIFFCYTSYIYDFPALFFFTAGLGAMVRRRWIAYFVIVVVSCWNKETTILLPFVFGIFWFFRPAHLPRKRFFVLFGAQMIVYVGVKLALSRLFAGTPGEFVEFHVMHNFELLHVWGNATMLSWVAVVALVVFGWEHKPVFLRRAIWVLAPLVGLTFFLGFMDELRDYYEAYPIVLLLGIDGVMRLANKPMTAIAGFGDTLPSATDAPAT